MTYRFAIFSTISIFSNTKDLFRIDLDPPRQSNIDLSNSKLTFVCNHDDTIDLFGNFLFGAIHKVRTLGRGEGGGLKAYKCVQGGGGLMPKTYVRLKKKMSVF